MLATIWACVDTLARSFAALVPGPTPPVTAAPSAPASVVLALPAPVQAARTPRTKVITAETPAEREVRLAKRRERDRARRSTKLAVAA